MHPISYTKGIEEIGKIIKKTKIIPDYINVGGGFPTIYPDLVSQPLINYFDEIKNSLGNLNFTLSVKSFWEMKLTSFLITPDIVSLRIWYKVLWSGLLSPVV